ncbi:unnamed protein product [marine sediment metagenome]|uniref:Uncharacterized protein n=1 Tax=marine sediment metagenome TaxID=412755 RepID=X0UL11_9ZZZZ
MGKDIIRSIEKRYIALLVVLVLVFVFILLTADITGRMFANIIAIIVMIALIPYAIILLIRKKGRK